MHRLDLVACFLGAFLFVVSLMATAQSTGGKIVQSGYAPVNGLKMYYEIHGEGEPLVLVHGGVVGITMFGGNVEALAKGRKVIAVELQGWHTLRHSYTTLLRQNGNATKVIQDLLRHASYSITANVYDSAVSDEKREAHSGVMRLVATRTSIRAGTEDGRMASA